MMLPVFTTERWQLLTEKRETALAAHVPGLMILARQA
jgi:hypothetical protein